MTAFERAADRWEQRAHASVGLRDGEAGSAVETTERGEVLLRRIMAGTFEPDVIDTLMLRLEGIVNGVADPLLRALGVDVERIDPEDPPDALVAFLWQLHVTLGQYIAFGGMLVEEQTLEDMGGPA